MIRPLPVTARWLGQISYQEAFAVQLQVKEQILAGQSGSQLLLLEHPPVITLGASWHEDNLLLSSAEYKKRGIELAPTDRGGDVTYHGPGQLVVYPIFELKALKQDLHWYIRQLEKAFVFACGHLGVEAKTDSRHSGIWCKDAIIGSIGVKVSRWITLHGVALNCSNDLTAFSLINPCGMVRQPMTSLSQELGQTVTPVAALDAVKLGFEEAFCILCRMEHWELN